MKTYLTKTNNIPKYGLLYNSIHQIILNEESFEIEDKCNRVDCIVCIGDLTPEIINFKQQNTTSVIRFLFRSDVSQYFYTDETLVDYTFWINDIDINILYPYIQTSEKINVPFDFSQTECSTSNIETEFDIYVNTGEFLYADSTLFKILRTLNRLTQLKIDICSKNDNIKNIVNLNICITDSANDIENHVKRSKMVIGSGYAILFAIKHHKPFIVLGERGYGGIPTSNNITQFYHEFFQGAIGGRLDGALPESLVHEDICNLINNEAIYDFIKTLSIETIEIRKSLIEKIKSIVLHNQESSANKLRFNTDYTIIKGNDLYWLLNRFTRFVVKKLEPVEMKIIQEYIDSTREINLKNNISQKTIDELRHKKILI